MAILEASNNGGRYNTVHNQTNDGAVFSVLIDGEYVPITFTWKDYLNTCQTHLLSASEFNHAKLMRSDCGVGRRDDSVEILFSWDKSETKVDGFSSGPSNELRPITHEENEHVDNAKLCNFGGHKTEFFRKDREYWTPDTTLKATAEPEMFGFEQYNPRSCPPDPKDGCGNYILKGDKKKC